MMKRGMLVDMEHMSQRSTDDTLSIAAASHYPVMVSTEMWMMQSDAYCSLSTCQPVDTHTAVDKRRLTALVVDFRLKIQTLLSNRMARALATPLRVTGYQGNPLDLPAGNPIALGRPVQPLCLGHRAAKLWSVYRRRERRAVE
jgi:hypothetical protein